MEKEKIKLHKLYDKFKNNPDSLSKEKIEKVVKSFIPLFIKESKNRYFSPENLYILEILSYFNMKINAEAFKEELENLLDNLENAYKEENDVISKALYSIMQSLSYYYLGNIEKAKIESIEKLVFLNYNYIFSNSILKNIMYGFIKLTFPNVNEIFDIYREHIFTNNFFSKSVNHQKAALLWLSQVFWIVYVASFEFKNLYEDILKLFKEYIKRQNDEMIFQTYYVASHIFLNLSTTQKEMEKFNIDYDNPLSDYIKNVFMKKFNIIENRKKFILTKKPLKIAFVYQRLIKNSPTTLLISLLETIQNINNGEYEIYVYDIEQIEKSFSQEEIIEKLKKIGVNYVGVHFLLEDSEKEKGHFYSHVNKLLALRNKIIQDDIDILILGNNLYQYNFLFTTRTAPKQIYWSHGNLVYNVLNIDERIVHFEHKYNKFKWKFFQIPAIDEYIVGTKEDKEEGLKIKEELLNKYGKETVILGSIGRLIKLNNEKYLQTITQIMRENPNTIYIAAGTGANIINIKEKIKNFGVNPDRFLFPGHVNPHVYGWVIDIYLDTFPLIGGVAVEEFRAKKDGPVVRLIDKPDSRVAIYGNAVIDYIGGFEKILHLNYNDILNIKNFLIKKFSSDFSVDEKVFQKDLWSIEYINKINVKNKKDFNYLIMNFYNYFHFFIKFYNPENEKSGYKIVPVNKALEKYRNINYLKDILLNIYKENHNITEDKKVLHAIYKYIEENGGLDFVNSMNISDVNKMFKFFKNKNPFKFINFLHLLQFYLNVDIRNLNLYRLPIWFKIDIEVYLSLIKLLLLNRAMSCLDVNSYKSAANIFVKNKKALSLFEIYKEKNMLKMNIEKDIKEIFS